jgi:hypothetical protein
MSRLHACGAPGSRLGSHHPDRQRVMELSPVAAPLISKENASYAGISLRQPDQVITSWCVVAPVRRCLVRLVDRLHSGTIFAYAIPSGFGVPSGVRIPPERGRRRARPDLARLPATARRFDAVGAGPASAGDRLLHRTRSGANPPRPFGSVRWKDESSDRVASEVLPVAASAAGNST